MDIKGMKVAELKEELKRRGLATHGLKAELAERLAAAVEAEESTEAGRGDDGAGAGGDDSPPGDAPTDPTDPPPASEEDVDFLDDAPAAPDATPRDPKAEPVAGDDADPATRGVPDEEPEEEPDYEPDDEPTPPPKRPREEEEDADAPETDADAKRPRTTNDDERDRDGDDDDDGAKSPQAKSPTRALRIDNFVRPFTFNQVRALLRQFGAFASDGEDIDGEEDGAGLGLGLAAGGEAVWMNQPVKTHAIVVFASTESARSCAKALDGARWPEETGRPLAVSHVSVDEARAIVRDAERAKREHTERVVASKNRVRRFSRDRDDDGIRFTRAWPRIAWRERRFS